MGTEIILLAVGLALVLIGAEMLVEHASRIARHWGVSEFVIGATVVAFGTSAPEMVVSFIAALEGNSDMAAGNVIGSNILNAALILGLSALLAPIAVSRENRRRDIPLHLLATGLLVLIGTRFRLLGTGQDLLGRFAGLLFLALFAWYLYISFHAKEPSSEETKHGEGPSVTKSYLLLVLGLVALIAGGRLFVDEASALAHHIGLSDKFIAITVLAAGTSLPELATSCVAATKGKTGLALGNVIGSNITNILLVGQDREKGDKAEMRSDAMIICSINSKTKEITLCSLMRDMYVPVPDLGYGMLNHTYMIGGFDLLEKTIESNFGIPIDGNIEVDFQRFMQLIDIMGGVNVNITAEEAAYINKRYSSWNLKAGENRLTAEQALYYCRIRENIGGDWGRTDRQRKVIMSAFNQLKSSGAKTLLNFAHDAMPALTTNLTNTKIIKYAYALASYSMDSSHSYRIPEEGTYTQEVREETLHVLIPDLKKNSKLIKEHLYKY